MKNWSFESPVATFNDFRFRMQIYQQCQIQSKLEQQPDKSIDLSDDADFLNRPA
jgi:hypothetical protein